MTNDIFNYNPIESITLNGIENLTLQGLTIVVGPSSSGKTQLLHDLEMVMQGQERDLVICKKIRFRKIENIDQFISLLIKKDYLYERIVNDVETLIIRSTQNGRQRSTRLPDIQSRTLKAFCSDLNQNLECQQHAYNNNFFKSIGPLFLTLLYIDNRTVGANDQPGFDSVSTPPSNDLQSLYLNPEAQQKLEDEIKKVFKRYIWLDSTRLGILSLKIRSSSDPPTDKERKNPRAMEKERTMLSEGDGLKSYVSICISLSLDQRPICLIDEPEMCLHPPQAHALGKFIGKYGSNQLHSTIIATHSSHVLRGILTASNNVRVLRLTRNKTNFKGRILDQTLLQSCIKKPIARTENVLDGIFTDAVVIVESEHDRIVYEAIWENILDKFQFDIRFVQVGGTGGFAEIYKFYKNLDIPVSIISDLDIINDNDKFTRLINELDVTNEKIVIERKQQELSESLREIRQPDYRDTFLREMKVIMDLLTSGEDIDIIIKKCLSTIRSEKSGINMLKHGGLSSFNEMKNIRTELEKIVAYSNNIGLFLVPVGELEYWMQDTMNDVGKDNKSKWADEAARRIRDNNITDNDIGKFIESIALYLQSKLNM